ncbi:MAG: hypothetical protein L3J71_06715 [Victivallaceae bacterium]|nr:hypothetical protein [Victivallaceae bacterium]
MLNINAITYESQLSNHLTVGIDQGNTELRRLAIQLAWLWYHWQPDSEITKRWSKLLKQKGRQRKTAIVAMARQLMAALYRDIVKGEEIKGAKKNG